MPSVNASNTLTPSSSDLTNALQVVQSREAGSTASGPVAERAQPWKAFADPYSEAFKDRISRAPNQKLFNMGNAALTQYSAENR